MSVYNYDYNHYHNSGFQLTLWYGCCGLWRRLRSWPRTWNLARQDWYGSFGNSEDFKPFTGDDNMRFVPAKSVYSDPPVEESWNLGTVIS